VSHPLFPALAKHANSIVADNNATNRDLCETASLHTSLHGTHISMLNLNTSVFVSALAKHANSIAADSNANNTDVHSHVLCNFACSTEVKPFIIKTCF